MAALPKKRPPPEREAREAQARAKAIDAAFFELTAVNPCAHARKTTLTPDAIKRINFQIEQWCRMPEPGQAPGRATKGLKR